MAQTVKNLPGMQESWVQFLGGKDPTASTYMWRLKYQLKSSGHSGRPGPQNWRAFPPNLKQPPNIRNQTPPVLGGHSNICAQKKAALGTLACSPFNPVRLDTWFPVAGRHHRAICCSRGCLSWAGRRQAGGGLWRELLALRQDQCVRKSQCTALMKCIPLWRWGTQHLALDTWVSENNSCWAFKKF